ncbi:MAG: peptide chain release factor N(5)-glutamine methyltransferase, partial [Candidatus Caldatribacteriota bacterium]|nr:peptide chain release factor N(5)-glutamine methyltransferase [Candidatus Caldatribacteriota bacterium]
DYFKKIIEKSNDYLKKDGFLAMEIGIGQAKKIKDIIMQSKIYKKNIEIIKDYSDIERVIVAYKK